MNWRIHTDTDGHRWLVNPEGQWIASFTDEADPKPIVEALGRPERIEVAQMIIRDCHEAIKALAKGVDFETTMPNETRPTIRAALNGDITHGETSVGWETSAEWELEQETFHTANDTDLPEHVRKLISKLWKQYCLAAEPTTAPVAYQRRMRLRDSEEQFSDWKECTKNQYQFALERGHPEDYPMIIAEVRPVYAKSGNSFWPIGAKFQFGDRVRKTRGSQWHGTICGFYTTANTKIGYAVESEREIGSVQVWPEIAVEGMSNG